MRSDIPKHTRLLGLERSYIIDHIDRPLFHHPGEYAFAARRGLVREDTCFRDRDYAGVYAASQGLIGSQAFGVIMLNRADRYDWGIAVLHREHLAHSSDASA